MTKLVVLVSVTVFADMSTSPAQAMEHEEGILIDESASISQGGGTGDLFQEYLRSAKKLLSTEPPGTRVWVSGIGSDSFGGLRKIVEGWTPEVHGIFRDDLNRARRQLTTSFEARSGGLGPSARGRDIFGGLWHLKALFESHPSSHRTTPPPTRVITIFSDMKNEMPEFSMPELLEIGPERMLERARANGLVVPLPHYRIHVYGASTAGLTPRSWSAIRRFWAMYFAAAGAELVRYSVDCDVQR